MWFTRRGGVLALAALDLHTSVMQVTGFRWCSGGDHGLKQLAARLIDPLETLD